MVYAAMCNSLRFLPRGQGKLATSPINHNLWGTTCHSATFWALAGVWAHGLPSIVTQIQGTARAPSTVSSGSARWQGEGRAVPVSDGLFFNLISQFEFKQLSPLSERITLPCQVRKSIPSPAGQTASQTCVYFLGWHM